MAKVIRKKLTPDDPIFKGGPQVFTPIARAQQRGEQVPPSVPLPLPTLLDQVKGADPIKRGTVEESLEQQLRDDEVPKKRR